MIRSADTGHSLLPPGKANPGQEHLASLVRDLGDSEPDVRWKALCGLAGLGGGAKAALPQILRTLNDEQQQIRQTACDLVCQLYPDLREPAAPLFPRIEGEEAQERLSAIDALVTLLRTFLEGSASTGAAVQPPSQGPEPASQRCQEVQMNAQSGPAERARGENGTAAPSCVAASQPLGWEPLLGGGSQQAALKFGSAEGLDALIDQFWSDPLLQGVPRIYVGDSTVVVPASVVEHLRQTGHEFIAQKVVSAGDLPAEEVNRIRRSEVPC
jgi:hypothetical protein